MRILENEHLGTKVFPGMNTIAGYNWLTVGLILLAVLLVYAAGLSGGFIFDDYPNIINNTILAGGDDLLSRIQSILASGFSSPAGRPLSMLTFAINLLLAGYDPFYFKLVNVCIHAVNGILLYFLIVLLLQGMSLAANAKIDAIGIRRIALVVALAWSLHPINLTSVLYVVQRMNSLSAMFVLAGLWVYTRGRIALLTTGKGHLRVIAGLTVFVLLAALCKENGILLPLYAALLEILLFRFRGQSDRDRNFLYIIHFLFVLLPLLILMLLVALQPELALSGYQQRTFTLLQRLLTESRVIWFYIYLILMPNNRELALFHDDFDVSEGLLQPVTTVFAIAGLVGLALVGWRMRKKYPVISFGIMFYLVGHSLESSFLPLELVHEHRNYLPVAGLLLALFHPLLGGVSNMVSPLFKYGLVSALLVVYALVTSMRAVQWGDEIMWRYYQVQHHPDSPISNYELARIYALMLEATDFTGDRQVLYDGAREHFLKANRLQGGAVEALVSLVLLDSTYGKKTEVDLLRELYNKLATASPGATGMMAIRAMLSCHSQGTCKVEQTIISNAINSLMNNTTLAGRGAATLMYAISEYLRVHMHDYPHARTAVERSISLDPDGLQQQLQLTAILIETGEHEAAQQQLNRIRERDILDVYNETIDGLQSQLRSR